MIGRLVGFFGQRTSDRNALPRPEQGTPQSQAMTPIHVRRPKTLAEYHDHLASIVLTAPDQFREIVSREFYPDQEAALRAEFAVLGSEFHLVERKLKDDHLARVCQRLIEMSLDAYLAGDKRVGALALQECRGLVWPMWKLRPKYAVEAERNVFGINTLYANTIVSPYPYEGTAADLSLEQARLLEVAETWFRIIQAQRREVQYCSWVTKSDGAIWRTSVEPREDEHPPMKPLQKSWGYKRLKDLGDSGAIRACVVMQVMAPLGDGIVIYDLEEQGRPRVSARQLFKREAGQTRYEQMRFHLEDAEFFPPS